MKEVGFKIFKTDKQYTSYCDLLENLTDRNNEEDEDDIELLTLLIEKYDEEHMQNKDFDPIELLELYMEEHQLKSKDLAEILDVNKSTISRILNYQMGLSKNSVRILSDYFAISQESLNRPYQLKNKANPIPLS